MFLKFKSEFHKMRHSMHNKLIKEKSWYFFKWEVWVILGLMLVVALLNVIPNWFVDTNAAHKDISTKYYLRNDIVYSSISIFITIGIAIFIGVFTEMGQYVGKYGSAIFVLVPALLWLFSERGHADLGLERVVQSAKDAADIIFWVTIGFLIMFAAGIVFYRLVIVHILDPIRKERFEYWNNFSYRMMLLVVNILIVVMMSYALINYALFTLHLGDLNAAERQEIADSHHIPISDVYPIVFKNDRITVFHSVVTAFFAVLMVLIGLTNFIKESKQSIKAKQIKPTNAQELVVEQIKTKELNKKKTERVEEQNDQPIRPKETIDWTQGGGDV